jgi:hypothetical protein
MQQKQQRIALISLVLVLIGQHLPGQVQAHYLAAVTNQSIGSFVKNTQFEINRR